MTINYVAKDDKVFDTEDECKTYEHHLNDSSMQIEIGSTELGSQTSACIYINKNNAIVVDVIYYTYREGGVIYHGELEDFIKKFPADASKIFKVITSALIKKLRK